MRAVSGFTILRKDYTSGIWFFFALLSIPTIFVGVGILTLPLCSYLYFKRSNMVKNVLENGGETTGVLVQKFYYKRWTIKYTYQVSGKAYVTNNYLAFTLIPQKVGDKITVIYDQTDPSKAFVKEIYLP